MSTAQHGHDGTKVICVDLLLTMVQLRVLHLILICLGVLSIITFPATLKVSGIRDRQRDTLGTVLARVGTRVDLGDHLHGLLLR